MNWAGKQHPVETAVEWGAPGLLSGALGWAALSVGLPPAVCAAIACLAMGFGVATIRLSGGPAELAITSFEPATLAEPNELLLDNPLVEVELLLDDPLVEVAPDSRVVRLFARTEPTPGELVTRIADYLGDGRRSGQEPARQEEPVPDASAALYAALANIRASLR